MDTTTEETGSEVLTTQDLALIRSLEPRRLAVGYAVNVTLFVAIGGGLAAFSSGEWARLLEPTALLGGLVIGTVPTAFHVWSSRKALKRTAGETRAQVERNWHFFTDRGWALRLAGVAAGISALFVTLASVLTLLLEPLPSLGDAALEFLRLFTLGFVVLLPLVLVTGVAFRRALRDEVERDVGA